MLSKVQRKVNTYILKLFQEMEEEVTLPNSFYEVTVTLTQKIDKDILENKITGQYL